MTFTQHFFFYHPSTNLVNSQSQTVEHQLWLFFELGGQIRKCLTHTLVRSQVCIIHQNTALALYLILSKKYTRTVNIFKDLDDDHVMRRMSSMQADGGTLLYR